MTPPPGPVSVPADGEARDPRPASVRDVDERRRRMAGRTPRLPVGVLGLVVAAVLVRVALVVAVAGSAGPTSDSDSKDYLRLSHHLGQLLHPPAQLLSLTVFHPPGYPSVVAAGDGPAGVTGVLLIQVVLAAVTLVATFAVGQRVGGTAVGAVAVAAVAVEPLSVLYTGLVMSEITFTALLVTAVWLLLRAWDAGSWRLMLAAGLVIGLSVLVRPVASYLPLLLALLLVLLVRSPRGRRALMAGAVAVGFAVPVAPWIARNDSVAGGPLISSVDSYNILAYRAAAALAADTGEPPSVVSQRLVDQVASSQQPGRSEYALAQAQRSAGLAVIRRHPYGLLTSSARGFVHVVLAPGLGAFDATDPSLPGWVRAPIAALSSGMALVLVLGGLVGTVIVVRRRDWGVTVCVALTAVYLIAVSAGPEGESRFRVPIVPLLAVLAALPLVRAWSGVSGRRDRTGAALSAGTHERGR